MWGGGGGRWPARRARGGWGRNGAPSALHSRGFELLDETLDALDELVRLERISLWGVSHFGLRDLDELVQVRDGVHVQVDQVPYNLARRGVESGLLPWCRRRGVPLMACSPIEQGRTRRSHDHSAGSIPRA